MTSFSVSFPQASGMLARNSLVARPSAIKMAGLFHAPAPAYNDKSSLETPLTADIDSPSMGRVEHFKESLKNMLMIPVLPAIGYLGLDATGISGFLTQDSAALKTILGEGFGHAGLCFSLHYVLSAGWHFWKGITGGSK